jgi:speckle-type POZ protein
MDSATLQDPDFGFCVGDTVTFKVEITVFGELEASDRTFTDDNFQQPSKIALEKNSCQMLYEHINVDIEFIVGPDEERVPAHKCILMARSPVFFAMFSHGMEEEKKGEVHILEFEPIVIKELLHYIYTGHRSNCTNSHASNINIDVPIEQLFLAATKYQVLGLVELCEEIFVAQLSNETVLGLLQVADTYNAQFLKGKCLQYIANHASNIIQQREFSELDEVLLSDANRAINAMNKRRRCFGGGGSVEPPAQERVHDRRFSNNCSIM